MIELIVFPQTSSGPPKLLEQGLVGKLRWPGVTFSISNWTIRFQVLLQTISGGFHVYMTTDACSSVGSYMKKHKNLKTHGVLA